MKSNKYIIFILSALLLASCTTAKEISLPDGSKGYSVSCGGTLNSFASCFNKAGEMCGDKGYQILDKSGEVIPFAQANSNAGGSFTNFGGGFSGNSNFYASSFVNRDLFIKCGKKTKKIKN